MAAPCKQPTTKDHGGYSETEAERCFDNFAPLRYVRGSILTFASAHVVEVADLEK